MNNAIFFDPSVFQLRPITVEHKSADGQQWTYTLPDIAEQALIDPQGCDAWRCLSMSRRARSSACRVVCVQGRLRCIARAGIRCRYTSRL